MIQKESSLNKITSCSKSFYVIFTIFVCIIFIYP